jgi:hypothetical protein
MHGFRSVVGGVGGGGWVWPGGEQTCGHGSYKGWGEMGGTWGDLAITMNWLNGIRSLSSLSPGSTKRKLRQRSVVEII